MADGAVGLQCSAANTSDNFNLDISQNCSKCVEYELRLQQTIEELESVRLIIQMLRNEHIHEDGDTSSVQQSRSDLVENVSWNVIPYRSFKKQPRGKLELRDSSVNQLLTANQYAVLDTESKIRGDKTNQVLVVANKISASNCNQSQNKSHNDLEFLTTRAEQDEVDINAESQPNLQNSAPLHNKLKPNAKQVTYSIPTVINGQITSNVNKKNKGEAYKYHKIVLIGDSHVRGLTEKVKDNLNDSFNLIGITKPNANIEAITSAQHLFTDNLVKKDFIIFCGGTRDISSNDSSRGLRSIINLAQRTSNTNVIILEVPHRFDLPHSSCVNIERKLFNNKLQNRMSTFRHVKVLKVSSDRSHYTTHGLHFNKRGKNQMANNIVNEIKSILSVHRTVSPIVLQWNNTREQTLKVSINLSTSDLNKDNTEVTIYGKTPEQTSEQQSMARREEETSLDPQVIGYKENTPGLNDIHQEEALKRKSTRTRKNPATLHQDFLW